jgi:S-adenosylmethionine decarboxylase proenzyme
MFTNAVFSGKHLICDIKNIKNIALMSDLQQLQTLMNNICDKNNYSVLKRSHHEFDPNGFSILYLLSESHMSIHTFPEKNYIAFDLYTCRAYRDNKIYNTIYNDLIVLFDADKESPIIIDRCF